MRHDLRSVGGNADPEVSGGLRQLEDIAFECGGLPAIAVNVLLDNGQAFDHLAERAVHRLDRALRARDVLFERVDAGGVFRPQGGGLLVGAQVLDMHEQVGQTALDGFQVSEPGVRSVQPLHELDDAILEMPERDRFAARLLHLLDLVGHRLHQRLKASGHAVIRLRALRERAADFVDAMLETAERRACAADGELIDFRAQRLHVGSKAVHGLIGRDMRRQLAQGGDRALELHHRRGVFLGDDEIDLVRERIDGIGVADEIFRRRQIAQGVAHFGKSAFDAFERAAVDAGLAAFRDALVQFVDLSFNGFEGATRHRLVERASDCAKLGAQRIDRFLHARTPQCLDLVGDPAQFVFEAGQVLRRQRRWGRRGDRAGSPLSARRRALISATARSRAGGTGGGAAGIAAGPVAANWSNRCSRRVISSATWSASSRLRFGA